MKNFKVFFLFPMEEKNFPSKAFRKESTKEKKKFNFILKFIFGLNLFTVLQCQFVIIKLRLIVKKHKHLSLIYIFCFRNKQKTFVKQFLRILNRKI